MIKQEFHNWRTKLSKIQLDAWDELPEMDLYVDQVVSFINDHLAGINVDPLTKSMVNNYVKKGAIMAPIKRNILHHKLQHSLELSSYKIFIR